MIIYYKIQIYTIYILIQNIFFAKNLTKTKQNIYI